MGRSKPEQIDVSEAVDGGVPSSAAGCVAVLVVVYPVAAMATAGAGGWPHGGLLRD